MRAAYSDPRRASKLFNNDSCSVLAAFGTAQCPVQVNTNAIFGALTMAERQPGNASSLKRDVTSLLCELVDRLYFWGFGSISIFEVRKLGRNGLLAVWSLGS